MFKPAFDKTNWRHLRWKITLFHFDDYTYLQKWKYLDKCIIKLSVHLLWSTLILDDAGSPSEGDMNNKIIMPCFEGLRLEWFSIAILYIQKGFQNFHFCSNNREWLNKGLKTTILEYFSFWGLCKWFLHLRANDALAQSFRWRIASISHNLTRKVYLMEGNST